MRSIDIYLLIMLLVPVLLVWLSIYILRSGRGDDSDGGGDEDGGVSLEDAPDLDLPPGVTLPDREPSELVPA